MSFQTPILTEPIIRTPFTDMGAAMITQQHTVCKDFEMKYIKCLEAYGKSLGETKCQAFLEDFTECSTRAKQVNECNILLEFMLS